MNFLIDNALSPLFADGLRAAGHDAVHVRELKLHAADDAVVLETARVQERVLLTADADFGELLAISGHGRPSVVLFRGALHRRPAVQCSTFLLNLPQFSEALAQGAIVVIGDMHIRVRELPIK